MGDFIQLLPDHIANQIAAGEVIQRPASVVKELMENALDAGASKIEVIIKDAGKTLIQVIDNGKGMSSSDAELCFARHATSKVKNASDLFALTTKGFRGEALASIAAIAHVTLKTKQAEEAVGHELRIEGSEIKSKEETVCSNGSSFEVKNLFYNVPARRNFLKSTEVEFRHIKDEFERVILAHPAVDFTLSHNGTEIYNVLGAVLRKRIVDVIGDRQNERLVPIEETTDIVQIQGYVVKPEFAKKSRGEQFLFVNDRFFKDGYFNHAITKAFDGLIQPRTFPGYFLYFTIDPAKIDVNVHPTKTEIKFEEDKYIYSILVSSIRQALGKYNIAPTLDFDRETSFDIPVSMRNQPVVEPTIQVDTNYNPFKTTSSSNTGSSHSKGFTQAIQSQGFGTSTTSSEDWENFYKVDTVEEEDKVENAQIEFDDLDNKIENYLFKSPYIFTPTKNGLMLIHAKRAYERIVYDSMMTEFVSTPIASQTMLFPIEKEISKREQEIWNENITLLERLGFKGTIVDSDLHVAAIPSVLQEEAINDCLDMILQTISYQEIEKGDIAHVLIESVAKNVSKSLSKLTNSESIQGLIEQLFQCPEHSYTPSGKAIITSLSLDEIHQKF